MKTTKQIIELFESWSPASLADDWDNVGLLVGDENQPVKKILVALDATEAVINEAIHGGFDFIITHHPLIYNPVKRVTSADFVGRKILKLAKNGIGLFCAHTNLDKAAGGVNDCLAEKIGLSNPAPLIPEETDQKIGVGRVGFLSEKITLAQLSVHVKNSLKLQSIRFSGDSERLVQKIGICGGDGSGSRYVNAAISQNCDAYITGDLRYHCAQDALESGIALIDITHYGGEIPILDAIVARLKNDFEISATSVNGQVFVNN
jgi:dinuclear metal center YbgI/SA1388 family protein